MATKMSLCTIKYTYEHYIGINIEEVSQKLYKYVLEAFVDLNPQVTDPACTMDMPDYVDATLCKKDGSIFYELDILRRAINIPLDCQEDGLVLEIFIQNCDGTRYHKRHEYPKPWWKHKGDSPSGIRQLKITKTFYHRNPNNQEYKAQEDDGYIK